MSDTGMANVYNPVSQLISDARKVTSDVDAEVLGVNFSENFHVQSRKDREEELGSIFWWQQDALAKIAHARSCGVTFDDDDDVVGADGGSL